ncbi:MAG: Ig-like domain-containing protein, partial [Thermomicrobiales bacterium]
TGDAHANPDSYYQTEITAMTQHSATMTFYVSEASNPEPSTLANWLAQGFDFDPHPYVDTGYDSGFNSAFSWFESTFSITPRTVRTHMVRWFGWADAATIEANYGVQMEFNSYQWGTWLKTSSGAPALGYLSGSGQPMRFADASGNLIPLYQQHTNLVDEFLAPGVGVAGLDLTTALAASQSTIDNSIASYHTPIVFQCHVDYFYPNVSDWDLGSIDYARQKGALVFHAAKWLAFVQQRAATTFSGTTWSNNTLSFTVGLGGANQTLLIPYRFGNTVIAGVQLNGAAMSYTTMTIDGTAFAAVTAAGGAYVATYAADTTPPTVASTTPAAGATGVPTTTTIAITFSEAMNRTATQSAFSVTPAIPGNFSWDANGVTMTFTPTATLANSATYTATVSTGARDLAGNALVTTKTWSFTTAAATPPPAVTGVSPISGPAAGGATVTVSGSSFTGATAVRFGTAAATSFTVSSDTQLTAVSPANAPGTVDITVTTPVGASVTSAADRFTFLGQGAALAVTAVDAATGPSTGGTMVTISGAGFATGATVTFGGAAATNVTVASTTRITATTPAGSGSVAVVVALPEGQSVTLANGFTYVSGSTSYVTQTTAADFGAGTLDAGAYLAQTVDGEVLLAPAVGAEFSGALPAGWTVSPWSTGGGVTVAGGMATVDGALLATTTYYASGRSLEFVATFDATAAFQHAGLGDDLNGAPWAIFSTGSSGGSLYARTNSGAGQTDSLISGNWLGAPHRFRIDWGATGTVTYAIDGTQVASHTNAASGGMRPVASDGGVGGGTLVLNWLRLGPYAASGTFTSRVLDAGSSATWGNIAWTA